MNQTPAPESEVKKGYQRRQCSECGDDLGYSESNPCQKCSVDESEQTELLNCPFCGGKPKFWERKIFRAKYTIGCTHPLCFLFIPNDVRLKELHHYQVCFTSKSDCIDTWNTRAQPNLESQQVVLKATQAENARLREVLKIYAEESNWTKSEKVYDEKDCFIYEEDAHGFLLAKRALEKK